MQIQKKNIKTQIIQTAREEFFKNGYRRTSMRTIASESNVGLSNIYNYFKNKDEILEVILAPLLKKIDNMFNKHNDPAYINLDWISTESISDLGHADDHIKMIVDYRKEIDLYLHKCAGSKYENAKDELIDRYTITSREYLLLMKKKFPQVNDKISDFFIHIVAAWWIQLMSEVISHNLSEQEIRKLVNEYMTFGTGGWQKLMNL